MKYLADENLPYAVVKALEDRGHDVFWARRDSPGVSDRTLLERAVSERRILLTFDKDFGELAFRFHRPANCGVILLRAPMSNPVLFAEWLVTVLENRRDWTGCFSVIEEKRTRMRPMPKQDG